MNQTSSHWGSLEIGTTGETRAPLRNLITTELSDTRAFVDRLYTELHARGEAGSGGPAHRKSGRPAVVHCGAQARTPNKAMNLTAASLRFAAAGYRQRWTDLA